MRILCVAVLCALASGCDDSGPSKLKRHQMVTGAMSPTIQRDGFVIVDEHAYDSGMISRWDMVLYRMPLAIQNYGMDPATLPPYVLRIVGKPGEIIEFDGDEIRVDGKPLQPPSSLSSVSYTGIPHRRMSARKYPGPPRITLGQDEFFALGDNSKTALDSRYWGPLPRANIIGKVTRIE